MVAERRKSRVGGWLGEQRRRGEGEAGGRLSTLARRDGALEIAGVDDCGAEKTVRRRRRTLRRRRRRRRRGRRSRSREEGRQSLHRPPLPKAEISGPRSVKTAPP